MNHLKIQARRWLAHDIRLFRMGNVSRQAGKPLDRIAKMRSLFLEINNKTVCAEKG